MIVYLERPNKSPENLLELISEYSKVSGYKNQFYSYTQAASMWKMKFEKIRFTIALTN